MIDPAARALNAWCATLVVRVIVGSVEASRGGERGGESGRADSAGRALVVGAAGGCGGLSMGGWMRWPT